MTDELLDVPEGAPVEPPAPPLPRSGWRRLTEVYHRVLNGLLVGTVAILIFPVTLQIFSRYTALIPSYIWTEEMARFLFIWMIMLGAMVGVREGDALRCRHLAAPECAGERGAEAVRQRVHARLRDRVRLVGHEFMRFALQPHFGAGRVAAVGDPRRLAADRPHLGDLSGRADASTTCASCSGGRHERRRAAPKAFAPLGAGAQRRWGSNDRCRAVAGDGEPDPVRRVLRADDFARAGGLRARARVPAAAGHRAATVADDALAARRSTSYNSFILLAVPFFLLTANLMNVGGITDRLVRLSRTMVGHFPGGLAQINVVLSMFFAGISGSSTADAASQ